MSRERHARGTLVVPSGGVKGTLQLAGCIFDVDSFFPNLNLAGGKKCFKGSNSKAKYMFTCETNINVHIMSAMKREWRERELILK